MTNVSFEVAPGTTFAILGRSGCGKTTLLKIVAGLIQADSGDIVQAGKLHNALPPQQRNAVYLYQEALLFPHLNVRENLAFGLRIRRCAEGEIRQKVDAMLSQLGLEAQGQRMPHQLSGGQKQRVAFGRALIIRPQVLLLDEPFGALDVETRTQMQQFYRQMAAEHGITGVFVTHDLKEALLVGHRWGYLEEGLLDTYADRQAFMADARTGIPKEIEFWKNATPF